MGLRCKGCGDEEHVKNGFMRGKQRYRCKACGLSFTDTPPRGMPLRVKVEALLLYLSGLSMSRTAKLLGVSTPSVMAWIEQFAEVYAQKPEPEGRALAIEPEGRALVLERAAAGPLLGPTQARPGVGSGGARVGGAVEPGWRVLWAALASDPGPA